MAQEQRAGPSKETPDSALSNWSNPSALACTTASVSGEPVGNLLDNRDRVSTCVGTFTPTLSVPTSQSMYVCNGPKDILATTCFATDAIYGTHGAMAFDASGTAGALSGNHFVARQVSNTSLLVDLWTASGINTVLWTMTPQNATCWQGQDGNGLRQCGLRLRSASVPTVSSRNGVR